MKIAKAAQEFLATQRIAVTGVSRTPANHGSNVVYRRLRERGYDVYAVNPHAETVEGDPCYPSLSDIPDGVEAVVIATRPAHAEGTMRECIDQGVTHVWMHHAFGGGSVDEGSGRARAHARDHRDRRWLPVHVRAHRRRRPPAHQGGLHAHRHGPAPGRRRGAAHDRMTSSSERRGVCPLAGLPGTAAGQPTRSTTWGRSMPRENLLLQEAPGRVHLDDL